MSMVAICYDSAAIEYSRGISELSNAPHYMKQDTNSIEK